MASSYTDSTSDLDPAMLDNGRYLDLCLIAASPGAVALVEDLAGRVEVQLSPGRGNKLRETGRGKLRRAVGAIIGALLTAWSGRSEPHPSYRRRQRESFTGAPVGYVSFTSTMDTLLALGMVHEAPGIRYAETSFPSFGGKPTSNWPTSMLLGLAVAHGVQRETLKQDFQFAPPSKAPSVKYPVELKDFEFRRDWEGDVIRCRCASMEDAIAQRFIAEVVEHNALAATVSFEGCAPPRWKRIFHGFWPLHGRWYALGTDGAYQTLASQRRAAIRINGEPVVELDVKASHLTILRALAGFPQLSGDPYAIPGLEGIQRKTIKQWVLEAIGSGKPLSRWSARTDKDITRGVPAPSIRQPILAVHSYLEDLSSIVPPSFGTRLGAPVTKLVHPFITGIEAGAMTDAMGSLRRQGVLSLPVHDSLIVPVRHTEAATQAIREGFLKVCGVAPIVEDKTGL